MKFRSFSTLTAFLFVFCLASSHVNANDVNSTSAGILVNGGISTGGVIFGVIYNTTSQGELGTGSDNGFHFGAMANYNMLAIGIAYSGVNYSSLEWDEEISGVEYKMKSEGEGKYWTFDFTFGAKMFTEAGDMGYTFPFIGYRFWKATRNQENVTRNGTSYSAYNVEYELAGKGWIFGIRDFSTLPLDGLSIVLQSGLWYYNAPMFTLKSNGNEIYTTSEESIGFGFEIGLGVAMENIGLSVVGGLKMDLQATSFKVLFLDAVAGAGYAQFFLALSYEISI